MGERVYIIAHKIQRILFLSYVYVSLDEGDLKNLMDCFITEVNVNDQYCQL